MRWLIAWMGLAVMIAGCEPPGDPREQPTVGYEQPAEKPDPTRP